MDVRHHIATEFHSALTAGDKDRLRAVLDPAVTWTLPGNNAVSGRVDGAEAVLDRAALIASYGVDFALEHVLVSADNVALGLHNTARRGTGCSTSTSPPSAGSGTAGSSRSRPTCPTSRA